MKKLVIVFAFLLILGILAGCAKEEKVKEEKVAKTEAKEEVKEKTEAETIKIGVLLPLTGALGPVGEKMKMGAELAAKEINEHGGINGKKIELIVEDTQTDPAKAVEAAKKLIDINKVKVIVGAAASSSTLAIADYANKKKVVVISPASTSPKITEAGDYIFRVVASDALQGKALADLAVEKGYKTAATLVINNDYGIGIEDVFSRAFEEKGGKVVQKIRFDTGKGDYRTELEQIRASNPDVIMFVAYPEDAAVILKQAYELGINIPWIAAEGIATEEMFNYPLMKEAMEGMLLTKPSSPTGSPLYQYFVEQFKKAFNEEPGIYSDYTYDAVFLASMAIAYAGYDGEKIKDTLYWISRHYKGVTGDKTMDENGDIIYQSYDILLAKEGKLEKVGSWENGQITWK